MEIFVSFLKFSKKKNLASLSKIYNKGYKNNTNISNTTAAFIALNVDADNDEVDDEVK